MNPGAAAILPEDSSGVYHGNVKSHVFHAPDCHHYSCKNCIETFRSIEEAVKAGYQKHEHEGVEVVGDQIEMLVEQAHRLFGSTSIFEVYDLPDRREVIRALVEFYGPVDIERVDHYLSTLGQLKAQIGEGPRKWS